MTPTGQDRPRWLFEIARPGKPLPALNQDEVPLDRMLDIAWGELLRQHMPFLLAEDARVRLADALRAIEEAFFENRYGDIDDYYQESFHGQMGKAVLSTPVRHLAMLQLHLMEQAFFVLQLNRYANAPSNRGWMNTFRRWGSSPVFNAVFDSARSMCSRQFVSFYDNFLRYYGTSVDVLPVPHPWDEPLRPKRPPRPLDEVERERNDELKFLRIEAREDVFEIPGVFLDSGIVEMPDTLTHTSAAPNPPAGQPGKASAAPPQTNEVKPDGPGTNT